MRKLIWAWLPLLFRALVVWQLAWPALSKFVEYESRVEHFRHDYGIPEPAVLVPIVGFFELITVVAMVLGAAARLAAIPAVVIMLVAMATAGPSGGNLLVLIGSLAIIVLGSGRLSLWRPEEQWLGVPTWAGRREVGQHP